MDATVFSDISVETIDKLMKEANIKDDGYQYMYNGETGERIKAKICIVPIFYYRLQKFSVASKNIVN